MGMIYTQLYYPNSCPLYNFYIQEIYLYNQETYHEQCYFDYFFYILFFR